MHTKCLGPDRLRAVSQLTSLAAFRHWQFRPSDKLISSRKDRRALRLHHAADTKFHTTQQRDSAATCSAALADDYLPSPPPPGPQRALGVDYGRRQVGLAISTLGLAPRPLPFLRGAGYQGAGFMETAQGVVDAAVAGGALRCGSPFPARIRRRGAFAQAARRAE
jgi:hypothetical protein